MVQAAIRQVDTEFDPQVDDCYYHIDQEKFEKDGASLEFMIWQRLCWDGSCRFCKNQKDPKPVMPVKMPNSKSIFAAIKQCGKRHSYILANMSVTEVVFRVLLRNGNNPMKLSVIMEEVADAWQSIMSLKSISPASLQQMLDGENEYRITRTEGPAE